jgi:hypothetical protein
MNLIKVISLFVMVTSVSICQSYKLFKDSIPGFIFSAQQTSTYNPFRKDTCWTPSLDQIKELEYILPSWLASSDHKDSPKILANLNNYKRQYMGFIKNGNKYIYVNAFCDVFAKENKNWQTEYVLVWDGGSCFFQIVYDLINRVFIEFYVNGEA